MATIGGTATTLSKPDSLGLDAAGDLYVGNFNNLVTVFAPAATGDPVGSIAGGATGLSGPGSVAVATPLSVLTTSLKAGVVGHLYQSTLRAALGTTPYRWSVRGGRLPRGFSLSRDGELSGVPRQAGRSSFRITVTDAGHPAMTASQRFSIAVRCPAGGRGRTCRTPRHHVSHFPVRRR